MEASLRVFRGSGNSGRGDGVGEAQTRDGLTLLQLSDLGSLCLRRSNDLVQVLGAFACRLPQGWQLNNMFQECAVYSLNFCEP